MADLRCMLDSSRWKAKDCYVYINTELPTSPFFVIGVSEEISTWFLPRVPTEVILYLGIILVSSLIDINQLSYVTLIFVKELLLNLASQEEGTGYKNLTTEHNFNLHLSGLRILNLYFSQTVHQSYSLKDATLWYISKHFVLNWFQNFFKCANSPKTFFVFTVTRISKCKQFVINLKRSLDVTVL